MLNIARNAAIDKLRSKNYQNSFKNQSFEDNVNTIINAQTVAPQMNDIGLRKIVNGLKEEYRSLIELSYFQGYTHDEIAKLQGIPLGTVKTRIRTALQQLRNLIS